MTSDKGILIKNIYYMLSYAFQALRQSQYEELVSEDFQNIHDLFAAILGKGVARQLKQGLYREYVTKEEVLNVKRGRLNMNGTIRNKMHRKQLLDCIYDELSENNLHNRILKTTMMFLLRQPNVKPKHKSLLKKSLLFFADIDYIEPYLIRWDQVRFHRNNSEYRMLVNVCNLVLEGLLLSTKKGYFKMASFLDEQKMHRLYERFILEYYRYHHPELKANPDQIAWNLDDEESDLLPTMQTDITLHSGDRTLIIDAKYYGRVLQAQFDKYSIHSGNLYQIYTYVKNLDKDDTGNVSGMLLYAKTEEQMHPNNQYSIGGNRIKVQTLDLNLPFSLIAKQLEDIVSEYWLQDNQQSA